MERNGDESREISGNGGGRDPALPDASSGPRFDQDGANPTPEEGRVGEDPDRNPVSWVNWQSALYVFVLVLACVFLVPLTSFWWVVPLLGTAVPLALAVVKSHVNNIYRKLGAANRAEAVTRARELNLLR